MRNNYTCDQGHYFETCTTTKGNVDEVGRAVCLACGEKEVMTRELLETEFQRYVTIAKDGGYENPYTVLEKLEALIAQIPDLYAEQRMALEDRAHEIGELFWSR